MPNKAELTMIIDFDDIEEEGILLLTPSWFKSVRENQGVCPMPIIDGFKLVEDKPFITLRLTGTNIKEVKVERS